MFWFTEKILPLLIQRLDAMNNPLPQDHVYQFAASRKFGRRKAICFAAQLSGLYRSLDGGRTWKPAFDSLDLQEPLSALTVAMSPDFKHDTSVFVGLNGGILLSTDGGFKWEAARVPSPPPVILAFVISPNFEQDGILFASTLEDGVLYSSDRGSHWNAWNFGLLDLNTYCIAISPDFAKDETLFVGTQSGIFRSTNGGRAWREVNLPVGFETILCLAISPNFARDATLFAGTENQGLLRSTDGGLTWNRLGKSRLKQPVNAILLHPHFPKQTDLLILHGGKLLTSNDNGKTWNSCRKETLAGKNATTILAPQGFDNDHPIWVGLDDGTVLTILCT
jgi:photosystem II stability/assembly factor-like uncharacterized protein